MQCISDQIVYNFVRWAQKQPWYDETIIFLVGDHLAWDKVFERLNTKVDDEVISSEQLRQTYNLLLGSGVEKKKIIRSFSQFDYPSTILEAAGFKLLPRKFGLGSSLFNNKEKNLLEIFGKDNLNRALEESACFFNTYFIN